MASKIKVMPQKEEMLEKEGPTLKSIVHFYNTQDVLRRCGTTDSGEGTTCWPAPESVDNINTKFVGRLGLTDDEEELVNFMQTLTDGFMQR